MYYQIEVYHGRTLLSFVWCGREIFCFFGRVLEDNDDPFTFLGVDNIRTGFFKTEINK